MAAERTRRLPPEFAAIPAPMFAWERRGDDFALVDWNDAAERQTQGGLRRIAGRSAREVYANQPDVLDALLATKPDTAPRTKRTEYTMLLTGARRPLEVALIPVGADLVLVASEDLTERRLTELALEESERRYRTLVEGAPDGIVVHKDGRILYVNDAFARIVGAPSPGMLVGTAVLDHVHPDDRHQVVARVRRIEAGGTAPLLEERLLRADGSVVHAEITGIPTTMDGQPAVQAIVRDVSERERMAAQLRQAQKMDAVGRLAGGIAHDFNNILTAIIAYADLVLAELPETNPLHADIAEIRNAGNRAAALTRQLMAFSRQQPMELRRLDVDEVVHGVASMLERLIEARITLAIRSGADTPKVMADRAQLEQVLLNLTVNARDAMAGEGKLTISTARSVVDDARAAAHPGLRAGEYACIQVTDTGPGIPSAIQPRIFEPFFTTKPAGKGTGLGLSVVYGIVKQSGGYITVDSPPGGGATFTILLPALSG